jgi:hypothetical protein
MNKRKRRAAAATSPLAEFYPDAQRRVRATRRYVRAAQAASKATVSGSTVRMASMLHVVEDLMPTINLSTYSG